MHKRKKNKKLKASHNSKMSQTKELNTILKGESMAIDAYSNYICNISDSNIKAKLYDILNDHKKQSRLLSNRIRQLGGNPSNNLNFLSKISSSISHLSNVGSNSSTLVKKALAGESNGIKIVSKLCENSLDNSNKTLVNSMLNEDKTHLATLSSLASELETNHK